MTLDPKTSPNEKAAPETELDESALSAIRSILTEEDAPAPRSRFARLKSAPKETPEAADPAPLRRKVDALPDLASADAVDPEPQAAPKPKRRFSLRRKAATPKQAAAPKQTAAPQPSVPAPALANTRAPNCEVDAGLVDRLRGYRPTVKHAVLAALVLLALFRPWLIMGLVVISIIILIGVFLIAGYDGFWHGVIKASRWYAARRPSRAAALNARLDRFAVRWDAILDRFPEGTVDGLYLPDFAELSTAEARHDEVVERRLAGMQEKGA